MTLNLGQELSAWREARHRSVGDDDYAMDDEPSADEGFHPAVGQADRAHHERPPAPIHSATIYPADMAEPRPRRGSVRPTSGPGR